MTLTLQPLPAASVAQGQDVTPPLAAGKAVGLHHWHARHSPGRRQFMVSCFYPAIPDSGAASARYLDVFAPNAEGALQVLRAAAITPPDEAALAATWSWQLRAQRGAPALAGTPAPVLIYYPGGQAHRFSNAALCEALAAAGYVVFTLDGPRDTPAVVFPDGKVVTPPAPKKESYIWPRIKDVRLLLDHLPELNQSGPLAGTMDLERIGMFGSSRGGYLSNMTAVEDSRIKAAVNMDGFLWGLWTDGTGLERYPAAYQERARALKIPILRIHGEGKSREAENARFELEAKDFGGNYRGIALPGFTHSSFGGTGWLCGPLDKCLENLEPAFDEVKHKALLGVLGDFFGETV